MPIGITPYKVDSPSFPSSGTYYFTSDSGMTYEVRFARKQDDRLYALVAFGVLNEEFEGEEYALTNRGEAYRVMATVVSVVKMYLAAQPHLRVIAFAAEPKDSETPGVSNQRLRFYRRYLEEIFGAEWLIQENGDRMEILRQR